MLRRLVGDAPRPLVVAAVLVVLEAVGLVRLAVSELLNLHSEGTTAGLTTALFFVLYAVLLGFAARALLQCRSWPRGPVLITQLIALGLAWNLRAFLLAAIPLALVAMVVVLALVQPASIEALGREAGRDDG